jgi:hypothetical protein
MIPALRELHVLVDPYQISGATLLQRWAGVKPRFGDNHVLGKPFVIRQRHPAGAGLKPAY